MVKDPFGNSRTYTDTTLVDDTDSRVKYSGSGWKTYTGRADTSPDFARTIHRLSTNGSYVTMNFTGTSITMLTEKNNYSGKVEVSIDGGAVTVVDLNLYHPKSYKAYQQGTFTRSGLTNGMHTIKVKKISGSYVYIDAFKVR